MNSYQDDASATDRPRARVTSAPPPPPAKDRSPLPGWIQDLAADWARSARSDADIAALERRLEEISLALRGTESQVERVRAQAVRSIEEVTRGAVIETARLAERAEDTVVGATQTSLKVAEETKARLYAIAEETTSLSLDAVASARQAAADAARAEAGEAIRSIEGAVARALSSIEGEKAQASEIAHHAVSTSTTAARALIEEVRESTSHAARREATLVARITADELKEQANATRAEINQAQKEWLGRLEESFLGSDQRLDEIEALSMTSMQEAVGAVNEAVLEARRAASEGARQQTTKLVEEAERRLNEIVALTGSAQTQAHERSLRELDETSRVVRASISQTAAEAKTTAQSVARDVANQAANDAKGAINHALAETMSKIELAVKRSIEEAEAFTREEASRTSDIIRGEIEMTTSEALRTAAALEADFRRSARSTVDELVATTESLKEEAADATSASVDHGVARMAAEIETKVAELQTDLKKMFEDSTASARRAAAVVAEEQGHRAVELAQQYAKAAQEASQSERVAASAALEAAESAREAAQAAEKEAVARSAQRKATAAAEASAVAAQDAAAAARSESERRAEDHRSAIAALRQATAAVAEAHEGSLGLLDEMRRLTSEIKADLAQAKEEQTVTVKTIRDAARAAQGASRAAQASSVAAQRDSVRVSRVLSQNEPDDETGTQQTIETLIDVRDEVNDEPGDEEPFWALVPEGKDEVFLDSADEEWVDRLRRRWRKDPEE